MSLSRTISLDTACAALSTDLDIELPDRRANGSGGRRGDGCVAQMRMKLFELSHLAECAPAKIAAPRLPQTGMRNGLDPARRIELGGHFMGEALVLHEAVLASRLSGLLIETHGIGVSPFEAGDLGRYQRVFVAEGRRIVVGPFAQMLPVRRQEFAPFVLLVG